MLVEVHRLNGPSYNVYDQIHGTYGQRGADAVESDISDIFARAQQLGGRVLPIYVQSLRSNEPQGFVTFLAIETPDTAPDITSPSELEASTQPTKE